MPWGESRGGAGTALTDYAFTGQRKSDAIGLYFYNARWYDSYITQFSQPDSIIPDPYNPLDWNRYSYVRDNPINYNDPSGHCSGDQDDEDNPDIECWNLINELEETYKNIQIYNKDKWTLAELYELKKAIAGHVFKDDILSAKLINFHRNTTDPIDNGIAGNTHRNDDGSYDVTLYDYAYYSSPDFNSDRSSPDIKNFEGTIIHELTHVAQFQNPEIDDSYTATKSSEWWKFWKSVTVGKKYGYQDECLFFNCSDHQEVAMIAATNQTNPNYLTVNLLGVVLWSSWQKTWIEGYTKTK